MSRVVVIGAGIMGLAAAYRAALNGHDVDLVEAAPEAGGMAGHFDFGGVSIERFYHFVCKTDRPTFDLLDELGLTDKLHWVPTTMGFFNEDRLYSWGDPLSLLRFPKMSLFNKVRYGVFALVCVRRNRWPSLERKTARQWILRWCGPDIYERFWKPLLDYKFYEYGDDISAAWIWTRIRRVGRSRRSILQEELGYIEGGSITLVNALAERISAHGGRIRLGEPATRVVVEHGRVTGVHTKSCYLAADAVISTAPTPYISSLVPDLPQQWRDRYDAIRNIGVICVILKLRRSVSPHFWVNISQADLQIPGIIEFSNLRKTGDHGIVYVPYYMPVTNEKFSWPDQDLVNNAFACLQRINPALTCEDVVDTKVARLRYGQPVCDANFASKIPPVQTPIEGLQIADTCFYYPEDRGIAESVRLGLRMAADLGPANPSGVARDGTALVP